MNETLEESTTARIADAEGSTEQAPLVYALVHALDRAITGEMVFRTPAGEAHTVTFFEGAPVRVEPGPEGDRIGEDLVAMDHITEEALAEALRTAESSRRRLGEILVTAGAIEPAALTRALTLQTAKRLALLANLPPESTFSLYFSARAEPEPHAPWAPLDTLVATVRAWTDKTRIHGTLRWLAGKQLGLSPDSPLDASMLTSREQDAVAMMRRESPSLKALYATVGNRLSALLYMLLVTRQFAVSAPKGAPMGRRKESDLIRDVVQVAVPISPVISAQDADTDEVPASAPPSAPTSSSPGSSPRPGHRISVQFGLAPAKAPGPTVQTRVAPAPPSVPRATPMPFGAITQPEPDAPGVRPAHRPSSPPKSLDAVPSSQFAPLSVRAGELSLEFARAEEAAQQDNYEVADRILRERCTEEDTASPDFQALAAWVKANLNPKHQTTALNDLTFLLMAHNSCESGLYYRGLLLKRVGKEKAALRDFLGLLKKNPAHAGALAEVKARDDSKKTEKT